MAARSPRWERAEVMGLTADQLAALLAGFGVLMVSAALAHRRDTAWLHARLNGHVALPVGNDVLTLRMLSRRAATRSVWSAFPSWTGLGTDELSLIQAGLGITPRDFLAIQLLSAGIGWILGFLFTVRVGLDGAFMLLALTMSVVLAVRVPRWTLRFLRSRRMSKFEQRFPYAIDTIANALEAGMSLPQSLDTLAREMPPPAGAEFGRVVRELNMGRGLSEALEGLLERVPSTDVDIFVTAVNIQYRIGGNLSGILRIISHTVRERLRIRSEIRVLTAQQRASSWIVTGAPVAIALGISLLNPEYMSRLFEPGIGRAMLIGAVCSVCLGFYVLQRIADIEV